MDIRCETSRVSDAFMKNSGFNALLTYALGASLIVTAFLSYQYIMAKRDNRRLAADARAIQLEQAKYQALVNECLQYSQKNEAIKPIIESVGIRFNN